MNPCNGTGFHKISGLLTQVSLGTGVAWGIKNTTSVLSSSVPFINWNKMNGNAANISVSQNYVFTLTMGGEVHRCPLPCSPGTTPTVLTGTYFQMSGSLQDDTLYAVGIDQLPYKYMDSKWINVANFPSKFIYSLNANDFIISASDYSIFYGSCQ